jgi:hypothetical protein
MMTKQPNPSPLDRLTDAGFDPALIDQTRQTFDQWRQVLESIPDDTLGEDSLNDVFDQRKPKP